MFKNKDYSFLSKILHHLVLGNNFIPEMLHDFEMAVYRNKLKSGNLMPHIFICGLPRSGTTILMRSFHETNQFASLTYRDMPFVILPNLWSTISNRIKSSPNKERIHKDKITINIDSPEALEEIFWRVKLQKNYILANKLIEHEADEFTIDEFKNFVSLILYKYKKKFYLSKNNNNILRLETIIRAFPNCKILIPFRDPIQQANSLLSQHQNFIKIQNEDKFIKKYMSYLAHYEFGAIHRPYEFTKISESQYDKNSIEYWLSQWINAYHYLSQEKFCDKKNIVYINYENMCENPKKMFENIAKKISMDNLIFKNIDKFKVSQKKIDIKKNTLILDSEKVFDRLKKLNDNNLL